ncbi:MAG: methyltransferase domain-containing protein [Gammaproteobacteria bacterium]|nr:methyltransferase domain-containing protein [Gammaproteobacteria bacterium]
MTKSTAGRTSRPAEPLSVSGEQAPAKRNKRDTAVKASIGPVEDLESYVKADWWRQIFNANYLRTDGDVVDDPEITATEIDAFLSMLDAKPDSRILDLCCGQGRHVLELARRGFTALTGCDRSHYLIARAKRVFRQQGLSAVLRESDARKLRFPDDSFDIVYIAGNSFGYFETMDDDIAVLKEVRRLLVPGGQLLIDFTDGDYLRNHYEARSWEWIDKNYFVCRERSLSKSRDRLISREVITHTSKGVVADQFYAERLYNEAELRKLLESTGFDPQQSSSLSTLSKRNQDLGMMAQRIVLTSRSTKTQAAVVAEKKRVRNVVVALGDHRRVDSVKPGGKFDQDDFHTINELKKALGGLDEYEFTYLDDHANMIDELRKNAKNIDFVLNLCDEGFNNEATKELHVPALLELLGLKYTGGDPQCLAYCYDKSLVRGVAQELDVPVPQAFTVMPEDTAFINLPLDFPLIVKPNFGDSSIGITTASVCYDVNQLEQAITNVRQVVGFDEPVLVEQFLTGKDISVGIIGNPPDAYQVLPIIEEDYSAIPEGMPKICGYEAKWDTSSIYFTGIKSIIADLPQETTGFLTASCIKLFERLGCRDYARFDWRLDSNGTPRLLEVNPNPGWCWDGHLARMAEFGSIDYRGMLRDILRACEERLAMGTTIGERKSAH